MRWIYLAVIILFAAATIVFAAQNFEIVTMTFLGFNARVPLALLVAVAYLLGAATGGSLFALLRRSYEGSRRSVMGSSLNEVSFHLRPRRMTDGQDSARTGSGGPRLAGRRFPRRVHLGRARSADRGAVAADRGDLRHVGGRDECSPAGGRMDARCAEGARAALE